MATLKTKEKFTLEIPQENEDNYIIVGKVLADTPQLKKAIKQKYKDRDKVAEENAKMQKKIRRFEQKSQNIQDRLKLIDEKDEKVKLLKEQQKILDEAYKLSDEFEKRIEDAEDSDIMEIVCKEHIDNRVIIDEKDKEIFNNTCEEHGYRLVWETIAKDVEEGKQKDTKN